MVSFLPWILLVLFIAGPLVFAANQVATSMSKMSTAGQEFLLCPGPTFQTGRSNIGMLTIMAVSAPRVNVKVVTPLLDPPLLEQEFTLQMGRAHRVKVPSELSLGGVGLSYNTIRVTANHEITVVVLTHATPTHISISLALPIMWAGTRFVIPAEIGQHNANFYLAIATTDDTRLKTFYIKDPSSQNAVASEIAFDYTLRGVNYTVTPGEDFNVVLHRFETFFIKTTTLLGIQLISNNPILVVAGHSASRKADLAENKPFYVDNQLATSLWTTKYLCLGLAGQLNVITVESTLFLVKYCKEWRSKGHPMGHLSLDTRSVKEVTMLDNCSAEIEGDIRIQVIQYITATKSAPSFALNTVPVDFFTSVYTLQACYKKCTSKERIIIFIVAGSRHGLKFLGENGSVSVTNKKQASPVGDPQKRSKIGLYAELVYEVQTPGRITVYHNTGSTFALYLLGSEANSAYIVPGGMENAQHKWHCTKDIPTPVPGDNFDNDCDNRIDEEHSNSTDLDKDGLFGEDVVSLGAYNGQWEEWSEWLCKFECDSSEIRKRIRKCTSPEQEVGEQYSCPGMDYQLGVHCSQLSSTCKEKRSCPDGTWGEFCENTCSVNCRGGLCGTDGSCSFNCTEGFQGKYCNLPCSRNTYGFNCVRFCTKRCFHTNCQPVNGTCLQEGKNYTYFAAVFPIVMMAPLIMIIMLHKFCRGKSTLGLLRQVMQRTSTLNQETKLMERRSSVTSGTIRRLSEEQSQPLDN